MTYSFIKKQIVLIILLSFALLNIACRKNSTIVEPPNEEHDSLFLTVIDLTHHSVTLNLKHTIIPSPVFIKLKRNLNNQEVEIDSFALYGTDTTVIDDDKGNGLLLDTTYNYLAIKTEQPGNRVDSSNKVTVKTLALTNTNYAWQEFVIGDTWSELNGVWGTDENDVYAVGGVTLNGKFYSIMHYDGINWTPIDSAGGNAIFGFSKSDIWVVGGGVFHYDGIKWKQVDAYSINHQGFPLDTVLFNNGPYLGIWGTSSSNLYLTNSWGKIIHWNGRKAEIVYSNNNTGLTLKKIDGISIDFIIATGTTMAGSTLTIYFDGTGWKEYPQIDNTWSLNSVSIINQNQVYFAGDGIFEWKKNYFSKIVSTGYYVWDIAYNQQTGEIVTVGVLDGLHIFNGKIWKSFKGQISNDHTSYKNIFLLPNRVFCVGSNGINAKIIIGKK